MSPRIALGLDLYRIYAANGRYLPASWIARAVGVSPTTMSKYMTIYCPEYQPRKGWVPGLGWNWSRSRLAASVRRMSNQEVIWSNGKSWEVGPEPSPEEMVKIEAGEEDVSLSFIDAMEIVEEGMAVLRLDDCKRIVFRGEDGALLVGTSDEKSFCTATGPYIPTFEDIKARDWCIDAKMNG